MAYTDQGALGGDYFLPRAKIKQTLKDPSKTPLVLVACGSFSPITYLHLRMFEMASDCIRLETNFELVGCYLSPVSDAYKKEGLAVAKDRYGCFTAVAGRFAKQTE